MATVPFMKFYISDYLIDTQHLTTLEHGAYLLLIMTYFQTGKSLPDNDRKLSQFCKLSVAKFLKVKTVLKEFFFISDGKWVHKRVEKEIDEMLKKSDLARVSANNRWSKFEEESKERDDANALRTHCERNTNAMLPDKIREDKTREELKALSGKPDVTPLNPSNLEVKKQAIEVLEFLNEKTGKKFRNVDANLNLIVARLKSGITVQKCFSVIAKKRRDWIGDEKMAPYLRPATLFNKTKFEQYLGELLNLGENE